MGNHLHQIVKCHTCPRRKALGGPKSNGKWASAEKSGWVSLFGWSNKTKDFNVTLKANEWIWLCPTCARKRARTKERS